MNTHKGTNMTNTRKFFFALAFAFSPAVFAVSNQACAIGADSALLQPLNHPYAASHTEWTAAARVFVSITRTCPKGPSDAQSRARVFDYIDGKLSLDYNRLCEIWTNGNAGSGDGCVNEEEQNDLRAYLDQIVDPLRDSDRVNMILKHGNALAISKFGPSVERRVLDMASGPQPLEPVHDPQVEALRTLGYWLLPNESRFNQQDKARFTALLLQSLPPADNVAGGHETLLARAILQALGSSSRAEVAETLRKWAKLNEATLKYPSRLAENAKTAAMTVEKRAQQAQ
jgi:hypothetical protein